MQSFYFVSSEDAKPLLSQTDYEDWLNHKEWKGPGVYFLEQTKVHNGDKYGYYYDIETFVHETDYIKNIEMDLESAKQQRDRVLAKFFNKETRNENEGFA